VIEPDVVALLESGCSTFVGTVGADGSPSASHAIGIQVLDGGTKLRVVLNAEEHEALANLDSTAVVALGATDVTTLRSVQVKGRALSVEPATVDDRLRTERYTAEFFQALNETDGTPIELPARLVPRDFVVLEMTVDEHFDQTPGPQAGARLGPA
jgi:hypothetical protein